MSRNVIKPLDDSENIVKPQQNTAADVVRSPSDYASSVIRPDYASAVAAENRYIQHGGDGQDRSIEEQRKANEALDSIKFDGDIDLNREKTREQLGYRDYQYQSTEHAEPDQRRRPAQAYQAERYRQDYVESSTQKQEARYGVIEQAVNGVAVIGGVAGNAAITGAASSVIKPDVAGVAGAAVIKSDISATAKDIVKPTGKEAFTSQIKDTSGEELKKQGLIKTIGGIAVRETVAAIGHGGEDITDKAKGQAVKYGYKAGKYAALSTAAVTRGTYGLAKEAIKQRKGVVASNFSPLKKSAANKVIKDKAKAGVAAGGTSIKKIIKNEIVQGIEDFHGSDDLGMKALTAPKDVYVKTKRTVKTVRAAAGTVKTVARGTVKTAKATAAGARKIAASTKSAFSNPVFIKNSLVAGAAIVLIALLMAVVASITSIIPSVSLKSDDKELTRTYEHITKLDAELTDEIRSIPDGVAGWGIDEFHYYINGSATSADNITIYTNADYILMYLDTKYDDYAFNKLIYGIFGGTNIKGEVEAIHNNLHSYSTHKWKEEVHHGDSDPDDGVDDSWTETIWHLDIKVQTQGFEQYLSDNVTTLLTDDEKERFNVLMDVGAYTAHNELGNPFGDEDYYISSRWGWRIHPISGQVKMHTGIDIPKSGGTPIHNVMAGTVSFVGYDADGYGNYCTVTSANGERQVLYAHMQSVAVTQGQTVIKGDIIGYVGTTGSSTGNHLHLEYSIENGFRTNPAFYIDGIINP